MGKIVIWTCAFLGLGAPFSAFAGPTPTADAFEAQRAPIWLSRGDPAPYAGVLTPGRLAGPVELVVEEPKLDLLQIGETPDEELILASPPPTLGLLGGSRWGFGFREGLWFALGFAAAIVVTGTSAIILGAIR